MIYTPLRNLLAITAWCACSWLGGVATDAIAEVVIVAHRGASHDAPENTLAGFKLAWEFQADAIEGDFYLTRDQQIVCIHDDTTERVARLNLPVSQSTLAELQQLDVGSWKDERFADQRIPTLSEVLAVVPCEKRIFIEIKCGPEIVPFLAEALQRSRLTTMQTVLISFKPEVISAAKSAIPDCKAYLLIGFEKARRSNTWSPTCEEVIQTATNVNADGVDLAGNLEVVDQDFIARCRQAGLSLHVWTIDDPRDAKQFQQLGVDSITTNRPDALRRILFSPSKERALGQIPAPVAVPQVAPHAAVP